MRSGYRNARPTRLEADGRSARHLRQERRPLGSDDEVESEVIGVEATRARVTTVLASVELDAAASGCGRESNDGEERRLRPGLSEQEHHGNLDIDMTVALDPQPDPLKHQHRASGDVRYGDRLRRGALDTCLVARPVIGQNHALLAA